MTTIWAWDLYPLDRDSWGNRKIANRGYKPGQTLTLERPTARPRRRTCGKYIGGERAGEPISYKRPKERPRKRPFQVPTEDDLAVVRRWLPGRDPHNPDWFRIGTELMRHGYDRDNLRICNAPDLLAMLDRCPCAAEAKGDNPPAPDDVIPAAAPPIQGRSAGEIALAVRDRFTFTRGLARFDGKDLPLPAGRPVEVLHRLVQSYNEPVKHQDLHDLSGGSSASEDLRTAIARIRAALRTAKVPCSIRTVRGEGYFIQDDK